LSLVLCPESLEFFLSYSFPSWIFSDFCLTKV
jgi:hypothetical protein